jgi:hypothetical protein
MDTLLTYNIARHKANNSRRLPAPLGNLRFPGCRAVQLLTACLANPARSRYDPCFVFSAFSADVIDLLP